MYFHLKTKILLKYTRLVITSRLSASTRSEAYHCGNSHMPHGNSHMSHDNSHMMEMKLGSQVRKACMYTMTACCGRYFTAQVMQVVINYRQVHINS